MRHIILLSLVFVSLAGYAQKIESVDANWIQQMKQNKSDTLFVINFWATWCKPCVHELPIFDSISAEYKNEKLKVILVSNDMKKDVEAKLNSYIAEKKITSQVVWMSEMDANKWINQVDKSWSGAIPATWLIKNSIMFSYFKEGEITQQELKLLIDQTVDLK